MTYDKIAATKDVFAVLIAVAMVFGFAFAFYAPAREETTQLLGPAGIRCEGLARLEIHPDGTYTCIRVDL